MAVTLREMDKPASARHEARIAGESRVSSGGSMERRHLESRTERLGRTKADLSRRLRLVCVHMDLAEFDQLMERMAMIELKYALRRDRVGKWDREWDESQS